MQLASITTSLLLVSISLACATGSQTSTSLQLGAFETSDYFHEATGLIFPTDVSGYRLARITAYPDPDLGVVITYTGPAHAEVFLYTLGYEEIPTGVNSDRFRREFFDSDSRFLTIISAPPYLDGMRIFVSEPEIRVEDKLAKLCASVFTFSSRSQQDGGTEMTTFLLMTSFKNTFVKLLFSHPGAFTDAAQEDLRNLLLALVDANPVERSKFFVDDSDAVPSSTGCL